jgi:hypothetical protein
MWQGQRMYTIYGVDYRLAREWGTGVREIIITYMKVLTKPCPRKGLGAGLPWTRTRNANYMQVPAIMMSTIISSNPYLCNNTAYYCIRRPRPLSPATKRLLERNATGQETRSACACVSHEDWVFVVCVCVLFLQGFFLDTNINIQG